MSKLNETVNQYSHVMALVVLLVVFMVYNNYMKIQSLEMEHDKLCEEGMGDMYGPGKAPHVARINTVSSQMNVAGDWGEDPLRNISTFTSGHEPPVFWPIGEVQTVRNTRHRGGHTTKIAEWTDVDGNTVKGPVVVDKDGNIVTAGTAIKDELKAYNQIKLKDGTIRLCRPPDNAYDVEKGCYVKESMDDDSPLLAASSGREGFYAY
jgi:hypothetical protein